MNYRGSAMCQWSVWSLTHVQLRVLATTQTFASRVLGGLLIGNVFIYLFFIWSIHRQEDRVSLRLHNPQNCLSSVNFWKQTFLGSMCSQVCLHMWDWWSLQRCCSLAKTGLIWPGRCMHKHSWSSWRSTDCKTVNNTASTEVQFYIIFFCVSKNKD